MLSEQDEGAEGFHGLNPNQWAEGWQALKKN
jgi:hypothetical protein